MSPFRFTAAAACVAVLTACNLSVDNPEAADAQLRVINVSNGLLDVKVDGNSAVTAMVPTNVAAIFVKPGVHQIELDATGASATTSTTVTMVSGQVMTSYVFSPNTSALGVGVLDTASGVGINRSKLRVSNFSKATDIEIWRTQPDFQTPIHIQTPFPYLATSPFLESASGIWEVFVTRTSDSTRVATTGNIQLGSTQRASVILMDSAGTVVFRVMPE